MPQTCRSEQPCYADTLVAALPTQLDAVSLQAQHGNPAALLADQAKTPPLGMTALKHAAGEQGRDMLPERHKVHACCVPGPKSACAAPDKDIKLQGRFNGQAGMLFWQPRNTSDTECVQVRQQDMGIVSLKFLPA